MMKHTYTLAFLLMGCSIQPQVTVDKPIVNVTLCIAVSADGKIELVECDAGASGQVP